MEDQGVECEILGLHDLIYKAIILPPEPKPGGEVEASIDASIQLPNGGVS